MVYKKYKVKNPPIVEAIRFTRKLHKDIRNSKEKPFWFCDKPGESGIFVIPKINGGFCDPIDLPYSHWLVIYWTGNVQVLTNDQFHEVYEKC